MIQRGKWNVWLLRLQILRSGVIWWLILPSSSKYNLLSKNRFWTSFIVHRDYCLEWTKCLQFSLREIFALHQILDPPVPTPTLFRVGVGGWYRAEMGGWYMVGVGVCYRVGAGGWYRVGLGGFF